MKNLSAVHLDFLKEMFNIGGGNAAGVLSQMFEARTDVQIPEIIFVRSSQLSSVIDLAKTAAVVNMRLFGDIDGSLMFVIEEGQRAYLINLIKKTQMGKTSAFWHIDDPTEFDDSIIEEFANILAAAYLGSIDRFCKLDTHFSVPRATTCTIAEAIEKTLRDKDYNNGIILIKNRFVFMETPVEALFLVVLNDEFVAGLAGAIDDAKKLMKG